MRASGRTTSAGTAVNIRFTCASRAQAHSHRQSGRLPLLARQKQCNPLGRFVLLADGEDCDHYGEPDKSARDSPKKAPKKYREQDDEWRHRQSSARNPRFKVASNNELDEVQTYEHSKTNLP